MAQGLRGVEPLGPWQSKAGTEVGMWVWGAQLSLPQLRRKARRRELLTLS